MQSSIHQQSLLDAATVSATQYMSAVLVNTSDVQISGGPKWLHDAANLLSNWRVKLSCALDVLGYSTTALRSLQTGSPNSSEGQWHYQIGCAEAFARCTSSLHSMMEAGITSEDADLKAVLGAFLRQNQFKPYSQHPSPSNLCKEYEEHFINHLMPGKTLTTVDRPTLRLIQALATAANFPFEASASHKSPGEVFQKLFECSQLNELAEKGELAASETRLVQNLVGLANSIKHTHLPSLGEKENKKGPPTLCGAAWLSPLSVIQQSREFQNTKAPNVASIFKVRSAAEYGEQRLHYMDSMPSSITTMESVKLNTQHRVLFLLWRLPCGFYV